MVRRHRRRKALFDIERERFARETSEMHSKLLAYTFVLSPLSDQYKAVNRLHDALLHAIREVTGEEPEWMRTPKSDYVGTEKP